MNEQELYPVIEAYYEKNYKVAVERILTPGDIKPRFVTEQLIRNTILSIMTDMYLLKTISDK